MEADLVNVQSGASHTQGINVSGTQNRNHKTKPIPTLVHSCQMFQERGDMKSDQGAKKEKEWNKIGREEMRYYNVFFL